MTGIPQLGDVRYTDWIPLLLSSSFFGLRFLILVFLVQIELLNRGFTLLSLFSTFNCSPIKGLYLLRKFPLFHPILFVPSFKIHIFIHKKRTGFTKLSFFIRQIGRKPFFSLYTATFYSGFQAFSSFHYYAISVSQKQPKSHLY